MEDRFPLSREVEIIAHRGFSAEAPENTLAALRAALEAGADAMEFDLHTAGDGTPVLLHDENLRRTTDGRGSVFDRTAEELAELDAGSWFDAGFAGEPVPTLEAALKAMAPHDVRIYAEIKGVRRRQDLETVASVVHDAGVVDSTVFISMDWEALDAVRAHLPEALVGYIVDKRRRAPAAFERVRSDDRALLDFDARILLRDPAWAARAAEQGVPLATWTVDSVDDAEALVEMGVPRITTNEVRRLVAWREERGG